MFTVKLDFEIPTIEIDGLDSMLIAVLLMGWVIIIVAILKSGKLQRPKIVLQCVKPQLI